MYLIGGLIGFTLSQIIVWTILPPLAMTLEREEDTSMKAFFILFFKDEDISKIFLTASGLSGVVFFLLSWVGVIVISIIAGAIGISFYAEKHEFFKHLKNFFKNV